ncbi:MAG TPA: heavy metal sensor histidine kinase, partial [Candidatus Polarisedimenticolia bacterium]|nr:heavy metal sensor histidine kinase [Candidatus Polarisedimenticolia bacterium]
EKGGGPSTETTREWTSSDGKPYILFAARVPEGRHARHAGMVQAALEISHEQALLRDYRRKMGFTLLFGILISAGAGAWVARHGLRPLAQITETAQRITQDTLHERVRGARWPRELEKLARVFDGMLERLERSFDRLTQFSADLAHELRTPINNLMGEAEVALSRARTAEEYRQVIESSLEECGRLGRMIESLLFIARAEGDGAVIAPRPLDGRAEIEAVRDFYDAVGEESGIRMSCHGAAPVHADPMLFRRALSNLVSNALRHTPRGGSIEMSVQSRGQGTRVTVSDTGTGIPPEHLPRVFDRFYRSESDRARYPVGAGLGLAIVKSIMGLHGGTVGVESRPGSGTVVTLDFPPAS